MGAGAGPTRKGRRRTVGPDFLLGPESLRRAKDAVNGMSLEGFVAAALGVT